MKTLLYWITWDLCAAVGTEHHRASFSNLLLLILELKFKSVIYMIYMFSIITNSSHEEFIVLCYLFKHVICDHACIIAGRNLWKLLGHKLLIIMKHYRAKPSAHLQAIQPSAAWCYANLGLEYRHLEYSSIDYIIYDSSSLKNAHVQLHDIT